MKILIVVLLMCVSGCNLIGQRPVQESLPVPKVVVEKPIYKFSTKKWVGLMELCKHYSNPKNITLDMLVNCALKFEDENRKELSLCLLNDNC